MTAPTEHYYVLDETARRGVATSRACACGERVVVLHDDVAKGVRAHQATRRHREWAQREGLR